MWIDVNGWWDIVSSLSAMKLPQPVCHAQQIIHFIIHRMLLAFAYWNQTNLYFLLEHWQDQNEYSLVSYIDVLWQLTGVRPVKHVAGRMVRMWFRAAFSEVADVCCIHFFFTKSIDFYLWFQFTLSMPAMFAAKNVNKPFLVRD